MTIKGYKVDSPKHYP